MLVMEESQELQASQAAETSQTSEEQQKDMASPSPEAARLAELEAQLAQARQEAGENWNKFLRERAEMENFRKRQERIAADRIQYQKKALLHKLLSVMDNVER